VPAWAALDAITITAASAGVVTGEVAADGAWLPAQTPVLGVLDPRAVRFEGDGLHGDLPRLRDGQEARIVAADPGQGGELAARLVLAPEGDPLRRTLTLVARPEAAAGLPAWARPGLGASLEITTAGGAGDELAIPVAATIRDGIDTVFFRRDRTHPDRVLRVVADLGANDGRWVAVLSGLKEGDEVVLDGIYQVMLAQRRDATPVGHVHADGTWHAGGH
jgi:HlyD family secretion protein